jgi:alanine-glyoxylate transaminase/serine-glyoxylate transaminase/serine-pyruvate transaminase
LVTKVGTVEELDFEPTSAPLAMVVGPTRPAPSVLDRLSEPARALTDPEFLAEFGRCLARVRELVGSPRAEVAVVPGTGTTGMETVVASFLRPGVPVLVASTGMWGDRWRDICVRNKVPVHSPRSPVGKGPQVELLDKMLSQQSYQALLVSHVDSSSSVRANLPELAQLARRHDVLFFVDGVSAIGAEQIEMDAWDVDVYLGAPPKGLSAPAGLAIFALRERALAHLRARNWTPNTYSLDIVPWLPVMAATERGEFGYFQSPSGNLVVALSEALRLALDEGRDARVRRHESLRDKLHAGLGELGIRLMVSDLRDRANGMTVCAVPQDLREEEFLRAVADEGVVLQAGTYPATGSRTFRIGHLGTVTDADITRTIAAVAAGLRNSRRNS